MDQQYCGTPPPPDLLPDGQQKPRVIGPVEQRLLAYGEVRGWCFGAWGEASTEVHGLVQRIAEERLNLKDTLPNQRRMARTREAERAGLVAYVRRALSLTAVKQQARLLLDRLRLLGDGAVEAGKRRQRAEQLEAVSSRERNAQALAHRQGRSLMRHGFGKLDFV